MSKKIYIGDSVYAEFNTSIWGDIILTTENGYGPTNTIYLEPDVIDQLIMIRFYQQNRKAEQNQIEWVP